MAGAMATPTAPEGGDSPLVATHRKEKGQADAGVVPPLPEEVLVTRRRLFNDIFSGCTADVAKQASRAERENASLLEVPSLTYGEMDLDSMHEVLSLVKRELGTLHSGRGIFLDLGSGAGKAVIAAGLLHPFGSLKGVERLECLSDFALKAGEKYREAVLPEGAPKAEAQFLRGDFVELVEGQELRDLAPQVAICLAVSTCYGEEQMQALARYARIMAPGSFIITFTQMLPETLVKSESRGWTLMHSNLMQMMWGPSTCFIYKKVPVTEAAGPGEPND